MLMKKSRTLTFILGIFSLLFVGVGELGAQPRTLIPPSRTLVPPAGGFSFSRASSGGLPTPSFTFRPLFSNPLIPYYRPIPFTRPSPDNHPNDLGPASPMPGINTAGNASGLLTVPQVIVPGRTFFAPDTIGEVTTDAVSIPGHYLQGSTEALSGTCIPDLMNNFGEVAIGALGSNNSNPFISSFLRSRSITPTPAYAALNACLTQIGPNPSACVPCESISPSCQVGDSRPACATCFDMACVNFRKSKTQCFVEALVPKGGSCRTVNNPVLVTNGKQDTRDYGLEDNWPSGPTALVGELIPDPLDSFFPTVPYKTFLFLPIHGTEVKIDNAATSSVAVLNYFPINPTFFDAIGTSVNSIFTDDDASRVLTQLIPAPLPGFLLNPEFQASDAPLFTIVDQFQDGSAPRFTLNNQNESVVDTLIKKSPKNTRSSPVAIQNLPITGAGSEDLAVLHQSFFDPAPRVVPPPPAGSPPIVPSDPLQEQLVRLLFPWQFSPSTAKDYCTNGNPSFLGRKASNGSSQPIDTNYLSIALNLAVGQNLASVNLSTPIKSSILGYLTSYQNMGGGIFNRLGRGTPADPLDPNRFCVGKTPDSFVKANLDGGPEANDLVVSNFGGFGLHGVQPIALDPGLAVEVAGGMTFVRNFAGGAGDVLHIPIKPVVGNNTHPVHPINVTCGDINGDGLDDCITTFMDGMGFNFGMDAQKFYRVPEVIIAEQGQYPTQWPSCEVGRLGSRTVCNSMNSNQTAAVYSNLQGFDNGNWSCDRLPRVQTAGGDTVASPASATSEVVGNRDIFSCHGRPQNASCPEFVPANASQFVYKVNYDFNGLTGNSNWPPRSWNCGVVGPSVSNPNEKTFSCNITGFEPNSWTCTFIDLAPADNIPDNYNFRCEGTANAATVPSLPANLESVNATLKRNDIVTRDALFSCDHSQVNVNRESEFAVYMNHGKGRNSRGAYNFDTSFTSNRSDLHYVNMAQYSVPRIVPDFPVQFQTGTNWRGFNTNTMSVRDDVSVRGNGPNNTIGLGVWPFHAELADVVNSQGAPIPDGKADAVIALNNSNYVAIIASRGDPRDPSVEPFTGSPILFLDSAAQMPASSPRNAGNLLEFVRTAVGKLNNPGRGALTVADRLSLLVGLASGTSFVTVPKDPINALNEFGQPETNRVDSANGRGLMTIHGFPWRILMTWINSLEVPNPQSLALALSGGSSPIRGGVSGGPTFGGSSVFTSGSVPVAGTVNPSSMPALPIAQLLSGLFGSNSSTVIQPISGSTSGGAFGCNLIRDVDPSKESR